MTAELPPNEWVYEIWYREKRDQPATVERITGSLADATHRWSQVVALSWNGKDAGYYRVTKSESPKDYERTWEEYWKPLLANDTDLMDAIKRELHDYRFVLEEVPKVYMHVTGNKLSKPNYLAAGVIQCAEEYQEELIQEAIKDALEEARVDTSQQQE